MQNKAFDRVNHWTLAINFMEIYEPLHIVKLFIFYYIESKSLLYDAATLYHINYIPMFKRDQASGTVICIAV